MSTLLLKMVEQNVIKQSFKDLEAYATFMAVGAIAMIVSILLLGYLDEKIIPLLGLNESGTAAVAAKALLTVVFGGISALGGMITLGSGLAVFNVFLKMMGMGFGKKKNN